MSEPRILVVGSTMVDLIAYAKRLPEAGETIVGDRFQIGLGGKGANQAVMAARFGVPVAMVNAVGDDAYGATHLKNFSDEGIDTTWMRTVKGSSGVAPIWVDSSGMNRIITILGANDATDPAVAVQAVQEFQPSIVVAQLETPQATTVAAFRAARAKGVATLLNPAPARPIVPELLSLTDWLTPNESEFAALFGGEATGPGADARIRAAADANKVRLVVTLGVEGAALALPGDPVRYVAAPKVTVVDTTGAGDSFVGAFSVGLVRGLEPMRAAELACACASASVQKHGTQSSYLSREEARALAAPYLEGA